MESYSLITLKTQNPPQLRPIMGSLWKSIPNSKPETHPPFHHNEVWSSRLENSNLMDFIIIKQCKETFVKMQSIQELRCCAVDMDYPQLLGRPKLLKQLRCADIIRLHRLAQARGQPGFKGCGSDGPWLSSSSHVWNWILGWKFCRWCMMHL